MSGRHPWSELPKHFTPEDREIIEAGTAKIVADSNRCEVRRTSPPARLASLRKAAPPRRRPRSGSPHVYSCSARFRSPGGREEPAQTIRIDQRPKTVELPVFPPVAPRTSRADPKVR